MRTLTSFPLFLLLTVLVWQSAEPANAQKARYRITMDSTWDENSFPESSFPGNAHYSGMIGTSHNSDYSLWQPGELASEGIVRVAETGSKSTIRPELAAARADGSAKTSIDTFGLGTSPGSFFDEIDVFETHPLVSVASMIAPSPDWIVGFHDIQLFNDGVWVDKLILDANGYDAGSDSGATFTARNAPSTPRETIHLLNSGPFADSAKFGTFTILRLIDGDLTEDGQLGADDIDAISAAIQANASDEMYDLNSDGAVNDDDRIYLISDLQNTYVGDSNLDGEFNSGDIVSVFRAGEYEDGIESNSTWATGDWDGNGDFDSSDIVAAFSAGGFEIGPRAASAAAVPAPQASLLLLTAFPLLLWVRRYGR